MEGIRSLLLGEVHSALFVLPPGHLAPIPAGESGSLANACSGGQQVSVGSSSESLASRLRSVLAEGISTNGKITCQIKPSFLPTATQGSFSKGFSSFTTPCLSSRFSPVNSFRASILSHDGNYMQELENEHSVSSKNSVRENGLISLTNFDESELKEFQMPISSTPNFTESDGMDLEQVLKLLSRDEVLLPWDHHESLRELESMAASEMRECIKTERHSLLVSSSQNAVDVYRDQKIDWDSPRMKPVIAEKQIDLNATIINNLISESVDKILFLVYSNPHVESHYYPFSQDVENEIEKLDNFVSSIQGYNSRKLKSVINAAAYEDQTLLPLLLKTNPSEKSRSKPPLPPSHHTPSFDLSRLSAEKKKRLAKSLNLNSNSDHTQPNSATLDVNLFSEWGISDDMREITSLPFSPDSNDVDSNVRNNSSDVAVKNDTNGSPSLQQVKSDENHSVEKGCHMHTTGTSTDTDAIPGYLEMDQTNNNTRLESEIDLTNLIMEETETDDGLDSDSKFLSWLLENRSLERKKIKNALARAIDAEVAGEVEEKVVKDLTLNIRDGECMKISTKSVKGENTNDWVKTDENDRPEGSSDLIQDDVKGGTDSRMHTSAGISCERMVSDMETLSSESMSNENLTGNGIKDFTSSVFDPRNQSLSLSVSDSDSYRFADDATLDCISRSPLNSSASPSSSSRNDPTEILLSQNSLDDSSNGIMRESLVESTGKDFSKKALNSPNESLLDVQTVDVVTNSISPTPRDFLDPTPEIKNITSNSNSSLDVKNSSDDPSSHLADELSSKPVLDTELNTIPSPIFDSYDAHSEQATKLYPISGSPSTVGSENRSPILELKQEEIPSSQSSSSPPQIQVLNPLASSSDAAIPFMTLEESPPQLLDTSLGSSPFKEAESSFRTNASFTVSLSLSSDSLDEHSRFAMSFKDTEEDEGEQSFNVLATRFVSSSTHISSSESAISEQPVLQVQMHPTKAKKNRFLCCFSPEP